MATSTIHPKPNQITTRKQRQSPPKAHPVRKLITFALSFVVMFSLILFAGSMYFVQNVFTHRVEKLKYSPPDLGLQAQTITIKSLDGIPLKAWRIFAPESGVKGVVIVLHGMDGQDASTMLPHAQFLQAAGYEVFALDMRAHGRSGGTRIGLAFEEPKDVSALLNWIDQQPDLRGKPLALLGVSMGGATAIRTAAMRPDVDAVMSVSSFASVDRLIEQGMEGMGAPAWVVPLFGPFTRLAMLATYGVWPAAASPIHDMPEAASRPVLILHGTVDSQVPVENAYLLHEASGGRAELSIVEGAEHFVYYGDASGPEDSFYREKVIAFLEGALSQ